MIDSRFNIKRNIGKINLRYRLSKIFTFKRLLSILIMGILILIIGPLTISNYMVNSFQGDIYTNLDDLELTRVAIVFGAGINQQTGKPSQILEDRILAAVELYKAGKIQKIIMSGDNRFVDYNEPEVMKEFAIKNGVRDFDIQADFAGRRTYDTCLRAKEIFGVNRAILITQEYHLPRAMYLCKAFGIESTGYIADKRVYLGIRQYELREILARTSAYIDVMIRHPEVILGEKIEF
jgi:SanA protein